MKIISHLIFILCCFWNVIDAAERDVLRREYHEPRYNGGYLDSTEEDWRRVCGGVVRPPQESLTLSAGTVDTRAVAVPSLDTYKVLEGMTPAKDQGSIGSCTTFAIVACLEYLVPGLHVSEAELFLRMITFGRASRDNSGTRMHDYIPLLREGVVEESSFIPYEDYHDYFQERKLLSVSEDFKESVENVVRHIREKSPQSLPVSMRPVWKTGMFPIKYRGLVECEYRDGYWRDQHFNCFPLLVEPNPGLFMSDSAFYLLKRILQTVPIVVGVYTFPRYDEKEERLIEYQKYDKTTIRSLQKNVWKHDVVVANQYMVNVPEELPRPMGESHAICLYGYDDSRQAFKFKNSWWVDDEEKIEAFLRAPSPIARTKKWFQKPWGDKEGSAWISYEYIRRYIRKAMVILPHPTEMWIDPDTSTKLQSNDKVVTAKFEEMLAAYKARRSSR